MVAAVLWWLPSAGVQVLKPYQTARLTETNSYNLTESKIAVGSGGVRGRGVAGATQTALDYLPAHATDFAFASVAEQRGFVGASVLLLLYLLVVWRGLKIVTRASDLYGAIVAAGIVFAFLFQVFVNVGMTIGIAPITGIPLPFVSVGGSSMISNLAGIGILLGIHARGGRRRALNLKLPLMLLRVVQQGRLASVRPGPIAVAGSSELVPLLAREIREDGEAGAVVEGAPPGHAAALVWIGPADADVLRAASRNETPIVGLTQGESLPYVLETNMVRLSPGRALPVTEIVQALARVLGPAGPGTAARLPALRPAVVSHLVTQSSLRNGLIGGGDVPARPRPAGAHAQPDLPRRSAWPPQPAATPRSRRSGRSWRRSQ